MYVQVWHQKDKIQFKFPVMYIVSPPEVIIGVRESLMLLVNNHIFKIIFSKSRCWNQVYIEERSSKAGQRK